MIARLRTSERGAVALFVIAVALALFLAIGIAVDGGGRVRALQRAEAIAAEAARAGGQAVVVGQAVQGQGPQLDYGKAQQAANTYLSSAGVQGSARLVNGTTLAVDVSVEYDTVFLSLIGPSRLSVDGSATARLAYGVTDEM